VNQKSALLFPIASGCNMLKTSVAAVQGGEPVQRANRYAASGEDQCRYKYSPRSTE